MVSSLVLRTGLFVGISAQNWVPPEGCEQGWHADECCCQVCPASGFEYSTFSPMKTAACFQVGGQCKVPSLSSYVRGAVSRRADPTQFLGVGMDEPEQVHLIGGHADEVAIVFTTRDTSLSAAHVRKAVEIPKETVVMGSSDAYSALITPGGWNGYSDGFSHPGEAYTECSDQRPLSFLSYHNETCMYTSGIIHTVRVQNLEPGMQYEFRPQGSERWRPFRMPPGVGQPVKFGIVADLGMTMDSLVTMRHMKDALNSGELDSILFPGDLSYADGFPQQWDDYAKLSEFLFETVPTAYGVGNHEFSSENFMNFVPRYGWPSKDRSASPSKLWYSFESGLAHVIMLCTYCQTNKQSLQYKWLQQDLTKLHIDLGGGITTSFTTLRAVLCVTTANPKLVRSIMVSDLSTTSPRASEQAGNRLRI